jgi:hypothetical protein
MDANIVEIYCLADELKNICRIEHTHHRSFVNFITNMVSAHIAYNFLPEKPSPNMYIVDTSALRKIA